MRVFQGVAITVAFAIGLVAGMLIQFQQDMTMVAECIETVTVVEYSNQGRCI